MKIVRPIEVLDAVLTSSNVAEDDYTLYSAITTYGAGDRVRVVAADVHQVWESLQGANTGNTPASSPLWWILVGATNRCKMFDASVQDQTSNADSIAVTLAVPGRMDSVVLLNLDAASAQVTMTDAIEGVVVDQSVSLISDSGITDWYTWFFEPIVRRTELTLTDLPPYLDPTLAITLSDAGGTVLCGECVLGLSRSIGDTRYGLRVGIHDYSAKETDQWGNVSVNERAFSKRGTFTLEVPNTFIDELQTLLAGYRATPVVYVGTDSYDSTVIYGFYKDFDVTLAYPTQSICTLEIEGLT